MNKSIDQIKESYDKYFKFFSKYFGEECSANIERDLGERLAVAPRSLSLDGGGYPGALIDFTFMVGRKVKEMNHLTNEEKQSLIKVCLIHELGKLGDEDNEQFVPQDSSYFKDKYNHSFKYNEKCNHMTFLHRTLFFITKYKLSLNQNEFIVLLTSNGLHLEENRFYANDNHVLAQTFQLCKTLSENELSAIAKAQNS